MWLPETVRRWLIEILTVLIDEASPKPPDSEGAHIHRWRTDGCGGGTHTIGRGTIGFDQTCINCGQRWHLGA